MSLIILIGLICLIMGACIGYQFAHTVIASECSKLGAFFVGDDVYHCHKIKSHSEQLKGFPDAIENYQPNYKGRVDE